MVSVSVNEHRRYKALGILGVLGYGASMAGVDIGPAALRVARLNQRIARLGYTVDDRGDMRLERPRTFPEETEKLKYVPVRSAMLANNSLSKLNR